MTRWGWRAIATYLLRKGQDAVGSVLRPIADHVAVGLDTADRRANHCSRIAGWLTSCQGIGSGPDPKAWQSQQGAAGRGHGLRQGRGCRLRQVKVLPEIMVKISWLVVKSMATHRFDFLVSYHTHAIDGCMLACRWGHPTMISNKRLATGLCVMPARAPYGMMAAEDNPRSGKVRQSLFAGHGTCTGQAQAQGRYVHRPGLGNEPSYSPAWRA